MCDDLLKESTNGTVEFFCPVHCITPEVVLLTPSCGQLMMRSTLGICAYSASQNIPSLCSDI
jgi:hypothetical protein